MRITAFSRTMVYLLAVLGAAAAHAGPLDPPAAPAPTQALVEPRIAVGSDTTPGDASSSFRISEPGSYYLAANVSGEAGKSGIEIASNNVTLDLMGFEVAGGLGTLQGIVGDGVAHSAWIIRNGTIRSWGSGGLSAGNVSECRIENVVADSNEVVGIFVGAGSTVSGCTATDNLEGFRVGPRSVISGCAGSANKGIGIHLATDVVAVNCTASENLGDGIAGGDGCRVENCTASGNGDDGIDLIIADGAVVSGCTANGNTQTGIKVGRGTIGGCDLEGNNNGLSANEVVQISDCRIAGATLSGIIGNGPVTVTRCTVSECGAEGITLLNADIRDCQVRSCGTNGIEVQQSSVVIGNTSVSNGTNGSGAGILVDSGSGNRIQGNTVAHNDSGINVGGTGNLIIANTARSNTSDYVVGAGNSVGPVVSVAGVGPISGVTDSDHPQANFRY